MDVISGWPPKRRKGGGEYRFHGRTLLTSLPSLKMRRNLWYDDCQLITAWDQTVLAIEEQQQQRQQKIGMDGVEIGYKTPLVLQ